MGWLEDMIAATGAGSLATGFLPQDGAPPQAPSPYAAVGAGAQQAPFAENQGIYNLLATLQQSPAHQRDAAFRERPAPLAADQNGRWTDYFADQSANAQAGATLDLQNDPAFSGQFAPQGDPSVTQYGSPSPGTIDDTYAQVAGMRVMDHPTGSGGRALGGLAGSQWNGTGAYEGPQSQALTDRLAQREESAAALQNMRRTPLDFVNPLQRMKVAYDMMAAEQEAQQQSEQNRIAQTLAQAKIDAVNAGRTEESRQFDATLGLDREKLAALAEEAQYGRTMDANRFGMEKTVAEAKIAEAQRQGQFTVEDVLKIGLSEEGKQYGGLSGLINMLREEGVALPEGIGGLATTAPGATGTTGGTPADEPNLLFREVPVLADREALLKAKPADRVAYFAARGKTEDEITALLRSMDPKGIGVSVDDPNGSSAIWEGLRHRPDLPMFYDDWLLGGGIQKAILGGDPARAQQDFYAKFGE